MAFRFLVLIGICGYVVAGNYDYNNPSNNQQSIQNIQNENVAVAAVVNSYTIDDNHQNAQPTPVGYDYQPKEPAYAVYYTPAKYQFSYGVHDELTGDIKSHTESREGDLVRGSYSLIDSDGYKRTVVYTADGANGFKAVVNREPVVVNSVVAPIREQVQPSQQYQPQQYQPQQYQPQEYQLPDQQQHQVRLEEVKVQNHPQFVEPRDSYAVPPIQTVEGPYP